MSQRLKAILILLVGVPLAVLSCSGVLRPKPLALQAGALELSRSQYPSISQTVTSLQTRTPTIEEQVAQATAAAAGAAGANAPTATPEATTEPLVGQAALPTPTLAAPDAAISSEAISTALDPTIAAQLDSYLNDQLAIGNFSGSVLIAQNGQLLFSKGYGWANAEAAIPNTPKTRFRLASVTKQFTSMSIMLLVADGKLKTSDPVCAYISNCPVAWAPLTIRHLLTHTSGLPNYTDFADFDTTEAISTNPSELLGRFRDLPLNFVPGTAYSYNNSGYVVLGAIIEQVSGMSYESFVQQRIFGPLGMGNSGYDHDLEGKNRAVGYISFGERAGPLESSTLFSAGALFSTVEDMQRWDAALANDTLLPRALRDEMWTPFLSDYAYGWKCDTLYDRAAVSHEGLISGFATFNLLFPDDGLSVIVLSNTQITPSRAIGIDLAGIVLGG